MRPTLPTAIILTLALAGLVHAHGGTKDKTVLARMDAMLDSKKGAQHTWRHGQRPASTRSG
ncbi:hypothetical protein NBRC116590_13570 [Pelagimonas sp. KU-00592-HH]|uniref:hypothetical protein n=1 Tax=Pelagimonas sp. KU-00592-HH TaxID=3127651 RepID=UPI0031072293